MISELDVIFKLDDIKGLKEHNYRVGILSHKLAVKYNLKDDICNDIRIAGKLHDIGKFYIPYDLLNKASKLSHLEFEVIKNHPVFSANILKEYKFNDTICSMVKHHHESFDGTGYPDGLQGRDIPLGARILKIVDVYDALTNDRVYRDKYTKYEALQVMLKESSKYDPELFSIFLFMMKANKR